MLPPLPVIPYEVGEMVYCAEDLFNDGGMPGADEDAILAPAGARGVVVQSLLDAFNAGFIPYVPAQGSVGASGDLAPLAHLTLALMGEGEALVKGQRVPAREELDRLGLAPLTLAAKEGLALINGTQASTALALHALLRFEGLFATALASGAMTVDAARGSDGPFDPRIHALRGQPGQIDVAQYYRSLLAGSAIRQSHTEGDDRVQDPYCLRCQPQVVGACLDQLRHAALVLLREANAVTDNPLVFIAEHSGGDLQAAAVEPALPGHSRRPPGGEAAAGRFGGVTSTARLPCRTSRRPGAAGCRGRSALIVAGGRHGYAGTPARVGWRLA